MDVAWYTADQLEVVASRRVFTQEEVASWSVGQVAEYLKTIPGTLKKQAPAFRQAMVDGERLLTITEDEVRGIAPSMRTGQRRQLMNYLKELRYTTKRASRIRAESIRKAALRAKPMTPNADFAPSQPLPADGTQDAGLDVADDPSKADFPEVPATAGADDEPVMVDGQEMRALYDYMPLDKQSIPVERGDVVLMLKTMDDGWSLIRVESGEEGWAPTDYFGPLEDFGDEDFYEEEENADAAADDADQADGGDAPVAAAGRRNRRGRNNPITDDLADQAEVDADDDADDLVDQFLDSPRKDGRAEKLTRFAGKPSNYRPQGTAALKEPLIVSEKKVRDDFYTITHGEFKMSKVLFSRGVRSEAPHMIGRDCNAMWEFIDPEKVGFVTFKEFRHNYNEIYRTVRRLHKQRVPKARYSSDKIF